MVENEIDWTVDSLKEYLSEKINDLRDMLQERYSMQTKAVDAAFEAQQLAMQTAKIEQATAMTTALAAQKEAVNVAMAASEKATAKSEIASDKRFEVSNGYRQQMQDQANKFATRDDLELRISVLTEKLGYESQRSIDAGAVKDKQINDMNMRLTTAAAGRAGQDLGIADSRSNRRLDTSSVISIISVVLVVVSVAITVITLFSR